MRYRDPSQVLALAKTLTSESWAVHGIPSHWNGTVTGLHVYCMQGRVFVVGYQVTKDTAQQHSDVLKWFSDVPTMKAELGVADAKFVLIFVSSQARGNELSACANLKKVFGANDCSVMDYPVQSVIGSSMCHALFREQGKSLRDYGPRELVLKYSKKRKAAARGNMPKKSC